MRGYVLCLSGKSVTVLDNCYFLLKESETVANNSERVKDDGITLEEIVKLWANRTYQQPYQQLLIIADFENSSNWVEKAASADMKNVSIQGWGKSYERRDDSSLVNYFLHANRAVLKGGFNPESFATDEEIDGLTFKGDPKAVSQFFGLHGLFSNSNDWLQARSLPLLNGTYVGQMNFQSSDSEDLVQKTLVPGSEGCFFPDDLSYGVVTKAKKNDKIISFENPSIKPFRPIVLKMLSPSLIGIFQRPTEENRQTSEYESLYGVGKSWRRMSRKESTKIKVAARFANSYKLVGSMTSKGFSQIDELFWQKQKVDSFAFLGDRENFKGTIVDGNGNVIKGEIVNGKLHGTVDFHSREGHVINLEYEHGCIVKLNSFLDITQKSQKVDLLADQTSQEPAFYIDQKLNLIHGPVVNGKLEGKTSVVMFDGSVFEGTFREGDMIEGSKVDSQQNVYRGKFRGFDSIEDAVVEYWNGSRFSGTIVCGKEEGRGTVKISDDLEYSGLFKNGLICGNGLLKLPNKESFEGEFEPTLSIIDLFEFNKKYTTNNTKINICGSGVYKWKNGDSYSGRVVGGLMSGQGVLTKMSGVSIFGTFESGRQKNAEFTYNDGTSLQYSLDEDGFVKPGVVLQCVYGKFEEEIIA